MSEYEVIEGDDPAPLTQHEPRTIVRTDKQGQVESMMSEIGDRVFVAWSICARCNKHVSQCTDPAGPTEPEYIKRWRDEHFQKTLDDRPNLTLDQELKFVAQLRTEGWIVERPQTDDPAIDRARDATSYDRPIEDVTLPAIPIAEMVGVYDTNKAVHYEPPGPGETCRMDGCDESLDDGEGWGGYCGTHADKVYGHEQVQGDNPDEIVHECDEDCPLYESPDDVAAKVLKESGVENIPAIRDAARSAGFDPGF